MCATFLLQHSFYSFALLKLTLLLLLSNVDVSVYMYLTPPNSSPSNTSTTSAPPSNTSLPPLFPLSHSNASLHPPYPSQTYRPLIQILLQCCWSLTPPSIALPSPSPPLLLGWRWRTASGRAPGHPVPPQTEVWRHSS